MWSTNYSLNSSKKIKISFSERWVAKKRPRVDNIRCKKPPFAASGLEKDIIIF